MRKRFVVLLESETTEQAERFHSYVTLQGMTSWHWFKSSWLLVDPDGTIDALEILQALQDTHDGVPALVADAPGNGSWYGAAPSSESDLMFKWMYAKWSESASPELKMTFPAKGPEGQ